MSRSQHDPLKDFLVDLFGSDKAKGANWSTREASSRELPSDRFDSCLCRNSHLRCPASDRRWQMLMAPGMQLRLRERALSTRSQGSAGWYY